MNEIVSDKEMRRTAEVTRRILASELNHGPNKEVLETLEVLKRAILAEIMSKSLERNQRFLIHFSNKTTSSTWILCTCIIDLLHDLWRTE